MEKIEMLMKTVLVVDDDPNLRDLMESLLEREGFQVVCASNGQEAAELLKRESLRRFDLAIMDLMMPGDGGFSTIRKIQGAEYLKTPVIVVTSRVLDRGTVEMIRQEPNVVDLLPKPLDVMLFKAKIEQYLNHVMFDDSKWKDELKGFVVQKA